MRCFAIIDKHYTSFRLSWLMKLFFVHLGRFGNTSIHEDFKLVIRKHILSYDNRQSCSWIKTSLWNLTWIQNGWSFNIIHIINVGKYEQTQINEDKMRKIINSFCCLLFFNLNINISCGIKMFLLLILWTVLFRVL